MPLALPFKINVPKTETTVNLKSASFVVIMLLHKGLTHIQSQIKPWLLIGESFTLMHALQLRAPVLKQGNSVQQQRSS